MQYVIDKLRVKALLALAPVLLIAVIGTASASAAPPPTSVTPAGHEYEATAGATLFAANNGTGPIITCPESHAVGLVPGPEPPPAAVDPAYSYNQLENGSVIGPISELTFGGGCSVPSIPLPATVNTNASPIGAGYSLTADGTFTDTEGAHPVAINIPGDGIDINIAGVCDIILPDQGPTEVVPGGEEEPVAASVMGHFLNGSGGTASTLSVRGQLPLVETCGLNSVSQGVFFADGTAKEGVTTTTYSVEDITNPNESIRVE